MTDQQEPQDDVEPWPARYARELRANADAAESLPAQWFEGNGVIDDLPPHVAQSLAVLAESAQATTVLLGGLGFHTVAGERAQRMGKTMVGSGLRLMSRAQHLAHLAECNAHEGDEDGKDGALAVAEEPQEHGHTGNTTGRPTPQE
ncbi:hypothetical protein AB0O47_39685 [Streptomyces noursei]|uniref:hypothetical protein n=1 Tax=Streptomyces noursei TaxID=1971 RepID=UPI00344E0247